MPQRRQGSKRDPQASVQTGGRTARTGGRARGGSAPAPERQPSTSSTLKIEEAPSEPPSSPNAPVKAWLDANISPQPGSGRDPFRVAAELATQHTDPALLPEKPAESQGLFELLPTVARRALTLGLAAREPSFHVFVSAQPEGMIEDDVVRFAERVSKGRETPPDIVYVHHFDHP